MSTTLAYCERSTATARSLIHIRTVGPGGRMPGGGLKAQTLCGAVIVNGWDIEGEVTGEDITRDLASPRTANPLCVICGEAAELAMAGYKIDGQGRPVITVPPVVQTWLPGNPAIPGARWSYDEQQWITNDTEDPQ